MTTLSVVPKQPVKVAKPLPSDMSQAKSMADVLAMLIPTVK